MNQELKRSHVLWKSLETSSERYPLDAYPKVSIVIPTHNCAASITETIKSVIDQNYPDFEVIVIDASSEDRTLEAVKSVRSEKVRVASVTHYQPYEMANKGIALAKGEYVNFLLPGDYYLYNETLKHVMAIALDTKKPELVYCGCLIRDAVSEVKVLFRPLALDYLKKGQQPTSLESCWFKKSVFQTLGKFNTQYEMRAGFDFMCRFALNKTLHHAFTTRILTDYDIRGYKREQVFIHFKETFQIIKNHFGALTALKWLFIQRDLKRVAKLWVKSIKFAFLGR